MNERDKQLLFRLISEARMVSTLIAGMDLQGFRANHAHIPWRAISGLRDITAHKYQTLRMEDVWLTATRDIPQLEAELKQL